MKWLADNLGTMVGAAVLSVLTWILLYSEKTNTISATAIFSPTVKTSEVGSLRYQLPTGEVRPGDRFTVQVTGPRSQLEALARNLTCTPVVEDLSFPNQKTGEISIGLGRREFGLPESVSVQAPPLRILFARLETGYYPLKADASDIADAPAAGFRVERIRVEPPAVRARVPADQVGRIPSLPIRPVHVGGRTETFSVRGTVNTDLLPGVRVLEEFTVEIVISPVPFEREIHGVPLHLSVADPGSREVQLVSPRLIRVLLRGPEEIVRQIAVDQLHAFVRVPATLPVSKHALPVQCDLLVEDWRTQVKVVPMPEEKPENRQATVQVVK